MTKPPLASSSTRGMRTYKWPPQPPYELDVAGVTSCISGGVPKPFLEGWAAKMTAQCAVDDHEIVAAMLAKGDEASALAHLKGARYRDKDGKADRGTIVHSAVEAYVAGRPMTKPELEAALREKRVPKDMWKAAAGMVKAATDFLFELEPKILHSEATVYSRQHSYAGTCDLLVRMRIGGSTRNVVVDFKTSKRIYDETALQLAAYSRADFIGLNDGKEKRMPAGIKDGIAVHLAATGRYDPVAFSLTDELFEVFLAAKTVALGASVIAQARRPGF